MRIALAASALAVTLLAAGLVSCVGPESPPVTPGPGPSGTPVFASDEEALAAAEEAYQRYLDVTNEMAQGGWTDSSRLAEVAAGKLLEDELASADSLSKKGYTQVGEATFDSTSLQQVTGGLTVTVYLCLDVSDIDVLDADGDSVVSPERPPRQPLEVDVDASADVFKVTRSDVWSGASFC